MKDEKVKKFKDKNTKGIVSKKKRFSLVSPTPQPSSSVGSHAEEEKTLVPLIKDSSKSPSLDLNANLLLLEQEAAFFHFALKEVHDLTG